MRKFEVWHFVAGGGIEGWDREVVQAEDHQDAWRQVVSNLFKNRPYDPQNVKEIFDEAKK